MKRSLFSLITLITSLLAVPVLAQVPFGKPRPATPGDIQEGIRRLRVLGSVLYVAAHPDDENTLFLTYLHHERNLRTAYLSLTRGDGGQNLIGAEQGENVGVIRTQELLAARRIDGPAQLFSRAYDFGFSKSTDEAVKTWGRGQVLSDIVYLIRKFRPDVIVTRFPPDSRAGHGHHSASAALTEEAFKLANDPAVFPEQLGLVQPWQARRLFWNVFIPGQFTSNSKPAEPGTLVGVETGLYNPLLGKSYGEIAAESRSQHKSQGFGVPANRGAKVDYLLLKAGDALQTDPTDGIDMTWNRVPNAGPVPATVAELTRQFNPAAPAASLPALLTLHRQISQLDTANLYVKAKREEVETLIQQCLGLVLEALPTDYAGTPGGRSEVKLNAVNRVNFPVKLISVRLPQVGRDTVLNLMLKPNELFAVNLPGIIPASLPISQPYWLEKPQVKGLFTVTDQRLIGLPENPPALTAEFTLDLNGTVLQFSRPWLYKYTDPVEGELYRPFEVRPDVTVNLAERVYAFADNQPKPVEVLVKANRAGLAGTVRLDVPDGWQVTPAAVPFSLKDKFQEQRVAFTLSPKSGSTRPAPGTLLAVATVGANAYSRGVRTISYPHIPPQTLFPPARAVLERLDITVRAKTVGYIAGAGDEVPAALRQLGCSVTLLDETELGKDLSRFDAIVVGIRAYNTEERLRFSQEKLLEYVRNGGTMVVQYATPGGGNLQSGLKVSQIGPVPFGIGRDRVAEEDAVVTVLLPNHPLLNQPNKITADDFTGWVQERGLYFAQDYGQNYESLLSMNDANEAAKLGSLIYAAHGKGHFIYTGLSFFRQLPNGVPGAYRLFANLISAGIAR